MASFDSRYSTLGVHEDQSQIDETRSNDQQETEVERADKELGHAEEERNNSSASVDSPGTVNEVYEDVDRAETGATSSTVNQENVYSNPSMSDPASSYDLKLPTTDPSQGVYHTLEKPEPEQGAAENPTLKYESAADEGPNSTEMPPGKDRVNPLYEPVEDINTT